MKWSLVLAAVFLMAAPSIQDPVQCASEISSQCPPPGYEGDPVYFAVPEHCSMYCECSNGVAWQFSCPPGTLYDALSKECKFEYDVDCGARPNP
ncbi:hypothetical protein O3P69_000713 [Scylla paramamosain]|uniref:Chitin-binding type-2 domain-containing protein n=1 Tax=Scylla paramamosain TaxID=85552 RepID=A0AAW0UVY8_SCYPA